LSGNKITFGLEKVHIAFLTDETTPTWDTPIHIPGAVSFTPEPQGDENKFYADNGPYFVYTTNNGYTAELSVALIPNTVIAEMLGWEIDSNGMLVETTDGEQKEFALMGQVLGDKNNLRFVYYRCKAARPGKGFSTRSESIEPNPDNLSITIMPIEINGKKVVKGQIELGGTNQAVYDAFFSEVIIPGATPSTVDKTELAATISLAGTLDELDYTPDSWTAFSTALINANTVNDDEDATQAQVNQANTALESAILALVPAGG